MLLQENIEDLQEESINIIADDSIQHMIKSRAKKSISFY